MLIHASATGPFTAHVNLRMATPMKWSALESLGDNLHLFYPMLWPAGGNSVIKSSLRKLARSSAALPTHLRPPESF